MRRRTRGLLVLLVLSILVVPQAPRGPLGHTPVIGVLMPTPAEVSAPAPQAFRQALDTLSSREGQSFVIESRLADGAYERLPALVAELVRLQVDVLLAGSPAMIRAATQATTAIPIVGGGRTGRFARFGIDAQASFSSALTWFGAIRTPLTHTPCVLRMPSGLLRPARPHASGPRLSVSK